MGPSDTITYARTQNTEAIMMDIIYIILLFMGWGMVILGLCEGHKP